MTCILYRAMCPSEAEATLAAGRPVYAGPDAASSRRFKFFALDDDFVRARVRDGRFGRSHLTARRDAYARVLSFRLTEGIDAFRRLNDKELSLDVRKLPLVRFVQVEDVTSRFIARGDIQRPTSRSSPASPF